MPAYSYATLSDAQTALAARLFDQTNQQWPLAELQVYITVALQVWNSLTSFWRAPFPFTLARGQNWYDLTQQPNSLRPFTVTDQYLTNLIEYSLLEPLTSLTPTPSTPATWTGSKQFSLPVIYGAITRRQNQALGATGCTLTQSLVNAPIVRTGIALPDTTIDIRRVAWFPAGFGYDTQIMRQADSWSKQAFDYNWTAKAQQPPQLWLQSTEPPPQLDVDNVPPVPGNYEVLSVNSGAASNATSAQLLSIPDDWSWLVWLGAMADLFGFESEAKDEVRAQYCETRFSEGLKLLTDASSVLSMQFNGLPMAVDAVKNGDNFNSGWESILNQGSPQSCYTAGLNLIGFPTPNAGVYGALPTVVQNAPVPVASGDYIQIARSDYDAMLDEAQHLAALKQGGSEFLRTIPLHQNFVARAGLYNKKLAVMGPFQMPTFRLSQRDSDINKRVGA